MKQFIPALIEAEKVFREKPDWNKRNQDGLCHYLDKVHGLNPLDVAELLNVVPGVSIWVHWYGFANSRAQDIIPRWQWRQCRERSRWCKKAIKELSKL